MTPQEPLKIRLLDREAKLPTRATDGSAGLDLYSTATVAVPPASVVGDKVSIGRALISTGICAAIPKGYVGKIGSRSGLSIEKNIEVGAGWIDSDYRGEIKIELKNLGSEPFLVRPGMRVAQLFILQALHVNIEHVDDLPSSERGERGFGSSGG